MKRRVILSWHSRRGTARVASLSTREWDDNSIEPAGRRLIVSFPRSAVRRFQVRIGIVGCLILAALLMPGCAVVKPWERGILADYTMRPDRDPLGDAQMDHIYFSREAASGGRGVGGGGCGCN